MSAAAQGNEMYTSQAARDTAHSLKNLTNAIRTVAATSDTLDVQKKILHSGQAVLGHSAKLVNEAQKSLQTVGKILSKTFVVNYHLNINDKITGLTLGLNQAAKDITAALNTTMGCLPGQRDVDTAITSIIEWSSTINTTNFPQTNKSYGELQQELNNAAANLNETSSNVVESVHSPVHLASTSKDFASAYHELLIVSMEMAGQTSDVSVRGNFYFQIVIKIQKTN